MFRSNDCVAIYLKDITAAENFYTNVMKFQLRDRSDTHLEYDTGQFRLCVNRDLKPAAPVPNFTVENILAAKRSLIENGYVILREDTTSLYIRDNFGIAYDIIERTVQTRS
jgi:hypothetical protein